MNRRVYITNRYADRIIEMYFRRTRFTCLDRVETYETVSDLFEELRRRFGGFGYHSSWWAGREGYWVNGVFCHPSGERLRELRRIHDVIVKIDELAA